MCVLSYDAWILYTCVFSSYDVWMGICSWFYACIAFLLPEWFFYVYTCICTESSLTTYNCWNQSKMGLCNIYKASVKYDVCKLIIFYVETNCPCIMKICACVMCDKISVFNVFSDIIYCSWCICYQLDWIIIRVKRQSYTSQWKMALFRWYVLYCLTLYCIILPYFTLFGLMVSVIVATEREIQSVHKKQRSNQTNIAHLRNRRWWLLYNSLSSLWPFWDMTIRLFFNHWHVWMKIAVYNYLSMI